MLSGIQTLREIDRSLKTAKDDIFRIDAELKQFSNEMTNCKRQQVITLQAIAKVRLDSLEKGTLLSYLSAADQNALKLLKKSEQALAKLEKSISKEQTNQEVIEQQREELLEIANKIADELATTEAAIQQALTQDAEYQTALERTQDADSIADEAERKAEQSSDQLEEKGEPYQADELFMYLWERSYGTSSYKNYNPLTRMLDGWVARKIKYHHSRANFWNIQEIPKRLNQHAESVREQANAFIVDLENLEKKALKNGGALALQKKLETARNKVSKSDLKIEKSEAKLAQLLYEQGNYISGEDEFSQQALSTLQQGLEHQTVKGLSHYVNATPSSQDDRLLGDMSRYQETYHALQDDVRSLRKSHDQKLKRLKELEDVRNNFKRHRYDDTRSGFDNDAVIGAILGQFLEGVVNGSEVWRVLQRNQRHRDVGAWPDYGSGGLGRGPGSILDDILSQPRRSRRRARQSSPWHWPNSNNGGFRLPTGRRGGGRRSSGGGGFKTGGGF